MTRSSLLARIPLAACALACALPACSGTSESPAGESVGAAASEVTTPVTASEAIARAGEWVTAKLPYCQSPNHVADPDPSCAATCTRVDNPAWDPYRSDCSGLVSWSWGLPAPGRTTAELAPAVTDVTHVIDPATLAMGDAVNKPSDHTMLFVAWITPGVRATFIEEPGCSATPPYAHQVDSDVTISGTSITVAYNGITFSAIRYDALLVDEGGAPLDGSAGEDDAAGEGGGESDGGASANDAGAAQEDAGAPARDGGAVTEPESDASNGAGADVFVTHPGCSVSRAPAPWDGRGALAILGVAIALGERRRRRRHG